jgi:GAF domain-containing protein
MSHRSHLTLILLTCAAGLHAAPAGDPAAAYVEQTYGQKIRIALATPAPDDEIALGSQMIADAKAMPDAQAPIIAAVLERAFTTASKTAGGDAIAREAMQLLIERVPAKRVDITELWVALRQRRYNSTVKAVEKQGFGEQYVDALLEGAEAKTWAEKYEDADNHFKTANRIASTLKNPKAEAIKTISDKCAARRQLMTHVRDLEKQFAAKPAPAFADELIKLYIVDLLDPVTALKYTGPATDPRARTLTPLATKPLKQLDEKQLLALADWYRGWTNQAGPLTLAAVSTKAHGYYTAFLKLHKTQDAVRGEGQKGQQDVEAVMLKNNVLIPLADDDKPKAKIDPAKLTAAVPQGTDDPSKLFDVLRAPMEMRKEAENPSVWADVLKLAKTDRHALVGLWKQTSDGIGGSFSESYARLGLNMIVKGSYQYQLGFRVVAGEGRIMLSLPIEERRVALVLHTTDAKKCGLELIDGKTADLTNTIVNAMPIKVGQEYTIRVIVDIQQQEVRISARMNGVEYVKWEGLKSQLDTPANWKIDRPYQPALGAHPSSATDPIEISFNHIKFQVTNGEAQVGGIDEKK